MFILTSLHKYMFIGWSQLTVLFAIGVLLFLPRALLENVGWSHSWSRKSGYREGALSCRGSDGY